MSRDCHRKTEWWPFNKGANVLKNVWVCPLLWWLMVHWDSSGKCCSSCSRASNGDKTVKILCPSSEIWKRKRACEWEILWFLNCTGHTIIRISHQKMMMRLTVFLSIGRLLELFTKKVLHLMLYFMIIWVLFPNNSVFWEHIKKAIGKYIYHYWQLV